jgi:signal transduction histidine kinase
MRRNGERVWIDWTNKVVLDATGQMAEILSIGSDITERRRAEEALRQAHADLEHRVRERTAELAIAKDRAEAADRLKSAFLATMSHELRTPLNSIIGFTGIILQGLPGPLNPEQSKQLEMVRSSARHLLALINDVLDISKIEAGQLEVYRKPFDLRAALEKAAAGVMPLATKKGLAVQVQVAADVAEVVSDRRRVEQVVINLLNNAIKFTEHGSITLTAERISDFAVPTGDARASAPQAAACIRVADTGMGIKPEDLKQLFQPFRQIDTGLTRQYEGTGLGLAICRRLADLLGAEIRVESEWGQGSVFTFTLPLE